MTAYTRRPGAEAPIGRQLMTNVTASPASGGAPVAAPPWAAGDLDPDACQVALRRRFPGVTVWFGEWTGHWFAMVNEGLLEALSPWQLAELIDQTIRPTWPSPSTRPVPVRGGPQLRLASGTWAYPEGATDGQRVRGRGERCHTAAAADSSPTRFRRFLNRVRDFILGEEARVGGVTRRTGRGRGRHRAANICQFPGP
jgi:hypothetical protein